MYVDVASKRIGSFEGAADGDARGLLGRGLCVKCVTLLCTGAVGSHSSIDARPCLMCASVVGGSCQRGGGAWGGSEGLRGPCRVCVTVLCM